MWFVFACVHTPVGTANLSLVSIKFLSVITSQTGGEVLKLISRAQLLSLRLLGFVFTCVYLATHTHVHTHSHTMTPRTFVWLANSLCWRRDGADLFA